MAPRTVHRAAGDVFTTAEVARATGVPLALVDDLVRSGTLRFVPGTQFIRGAEVIACAPVIRAAAAAAVRGDKRLPVGDEPSTSPLAKGGPRWAPSVAAHALVVAMAVWIAALWPQTPPAPPFPPGDTTRLVFLALPGPGGGGGGGGVRAPAPATRAERSGSDRALLSVPSASPDIVPADTAAAEEPRVARANLIPDEEPPPTPLPSARLIAPVAGMSPAARDREGAIEATSAPDPSRGEGTGGGAGAGQGAGSGPGTGAGLGQGDGGGTGGGVYRPGSGIDPPRLLREVKALYTEDARRRGITGEVLLEVVVTRDGGVGEVRVLRGLDAGLDARAVDAVRQWRFAPARRLGEPVDVLVEVAVEFSLR